MRIRAATADDAAAIASIYAPYVEGSAISFELEAPDAAEVAQRMRNGLALYPWLAAEEEGALIGYAYASAFRPRAAYLWSVETTVYVREDRHGQGIGSVLYRPLLGLLEAQGFTQAFAAIALPNPASVRIHESFGFAHAGTYRQVGFKLDGWWDVGLWQKPLAAATLPPAEPKPWQRFAADML